MHDLVQVTAITPSTFRAGSRPSVATSGARSAYCNEIGLNRRSSPTRRPGEPSGAHQLKQAGIYDLLISVQGLGRATTRSSSSTGGGQAPPGHTASRPRRAVSLQLRARLRRCPPQGRRRACRVERARAVNFLAFNPFEDQARGKPIAVNVPTLQRRRRRNLPPVQSMSSMSAAIEVNVRYLPFGLLPEREWEVRPELPADCLRPARMGERRRGVVRRTQPERQAEGAAQCARRLLPASRSVATHRVRHSGRSGNRPAEQGWGSAVSTTLDVLEERVGKLPAVGSRSALYGSGAVGLGVSCKAASTRENRSGRNRQFAAFVSSPEFRNAETLNGLPWKHRDGLEGPDDVVLNTSESSRDAITATLAAAGARSGRPSKSSVSWARRREPPRDENPILHFPGRAGLPRPALAARTRTVPGRGGARAGVQGVPGPDAEDDPSVREGRGMRACSLRGICDGFQRGLRRDFRLRRGHVRHAEGADLFRTRATTRTSPSSRWWRPRSTGGRCPRVILKGSPIARPKKTRALPHTGDGARSSPRLGRTKEPRHVLLFRRERPEQHPGRRHRRLCRPPGAAPGANAMGFYDYRNITPVPEYADRFTYLGQWRAPRHQPPPRPACTS